MDSNNPRAQIYMKSGETMRLDLFYDIAPITVANFVGLCKEGFYDGLTFHRIVKDFMIQGGAENGRCEGNTPGFGIKGEFAENGLDNPLKHTRGVISMARSKEPDSASTQFFILHKATPRLNGKYAAFGKLADEESFEVLERLALTPVAPPEEDNRPHTPQVIETITIENAEHIPAPIRIPTDQEVPMKEHVKKLIALLKENNVDAYLAYKPVNTRYLSGFRSQSRVDGQAVIDKDGLHFFANHLNAEQAEAEVEGANDLTVMEYQANLGKYIVDKNYQVVAVEENFLTIEELDQLKKHMPNTTFVYGSSLLNELRHIKTPDQIEGFRKACRITDEIFTGLLTFIKTGVTETEIESFVLQETKRLGAEGPYFSPIVVSGVRSSQPHGTPTDKVVEDGDFVTVDMGVIAEGCASDFTRTVVVGHASAKQREIYETVRRAQQKAVEEIRPGMMSDEADMIARKVIIDAGYGDYFPHSLGHGIDDGVRLSQVPEHRFQLKENMIFTVEPGIYISGFGGVRIEDTVLLTKDGCVPFYTSNKELIEIK